MNPNFNTMTYNNIKKYFMNKGKNNLEISDPKSIDTNFAKKFRETSLGMTQELKSYYLSPQEKKLRKETIRVFFKPNDLEFYNLNKKNDYIQLSLNKNATLQEVFLTKKKTEELFKTTHKKGNIYINDLWSEDYYKKVMKFAHLQEIIDDIKENQRKKNIKRRNALIKRIQEENENKKPALFDSLDNKDLYKSTRKVSLTKHRKFPSLSTKKKLPIKLFLKEKIQNVNSLIKDCEDFSQENRKEDLGYKEFLTERKEHQRFQSNGFKMDKALTASLTQFFEKKKKKGVLLKPNQNDKNNENDSEMTTLPSIQKKK